MGEIDISSDYELGGNDTFADPTPPPAHTVVTILYALICTFGLIGNGIILFVILFNPKVRTATTVLMFNLALSDFIFLASLPFTISWGVTGEWAFGEFMCKVSFTCFGINLFTGTYTLVLMSFDRFVAVCKYKWHTYRTIPNSIKSCIVVWVLSILLTTPLLMYSKLTDETGATQCNLDWPNFSALAFTIYFIILGYFTPLVLMTSFYFLIVVRLHKHSAPTKSASDGNRKRTKHVTKLVLVLILAYFLCWLPYFTLQLYFHAVDHTKPPPRYIINIYHGATLLYNMNSALNPLLYGFYSASFRKGILGLCQCKKSSSPAHYRASRASMLICRSTKLENGNAFDKQTYTAVQKQQKEMIALSGRKHSLTTSELLGSRSLLSTNHTEVD